MITIPINTNYRYKFPVIDQDTGKFITGITIAYSIVKTSDGTVLDSGNCSEIGATGIYYFDYTYAVAQEYDVVITTPAGYFDGFETVMVENAVDVSSSLTAYGVAKTSDIINELKTSPEDVAERIRNLATVEAVGDIHST
jgi:hypothetical protein